MLFEYERRPFFVPTGQAKGPTDFWPIGEISPNEIAYIVLSAK